MNKPERTDQFNLDHWNQNTDIIDNQLKSNADDISSESTRATNAESALRNLSDTSFKTVLLNFCHPIGSLYWSSNPTNPSELFGGTWTQIKDKFVWAKGDSDTVNATGGEKTHTLTVAEMPSHNHSFTPAGTVSVTSNPIFTGSAVTSSGMSEPTYASASYQDDIGLINPDSIVVDGRATYGTRRRPNRVKGEFGTGSYDLKIDLSHDHSVTAAGTIDGGAYKFTGSAGTTDNNGSDTTHNNMPPYIIKYCWERIA